MNYTKYTYFLVILSTLVLISCSSTKQITKLSYDIQELNKKFDQVHENIEGLKPEIEKAKHDANRANKRLDNSISCYKK